MCTQTVKRNVHVKELDSFLNGTCINFFKEYFFQNSLSPLLQFPMLWHVIDDEQYFTLLKHSYFDI